MIRQFGLIAVGIGLLAIAYVAGSVSIPPHVEAGPKPDIRIGQKTGYFNLARVLRESERARTNIIRLNVKRERMAANLIGLRAMHMDLQKSLQTTADPNAKHRISGDLLALTRLAEDTDRQCSKLLTEQAGSVITDLYKDLRIVTQELARERHLDAVLGYPGNPATEVLPEMEMILKAPAAHPFFLDPSVEFTDDIVRRLNEKFAADQPDE